MLFDKILPRFLKNDSQEQINYLSLTLTSDRVLATVWNFEEEKVKVLGFAEKTYQSVDSLIHQAAIAIDAAAQKAKSDVADVVFGLSSNWFEEDGGLAKDTSKFLKKISEDLELNSQAFIPISSSVKNYLKTLESITPQIILVGIFDNYLEVHLIKADKVEKTKVLNSKSSFEKIAEIIRQLDEQKGLPARIVIYGISEESKIAQELLDFNWEKIFVQQPKVEFLESLQIGESVAFSQAADILGHQPQLTTSKVTGAQASKSSKEEDRKSQDDEFGFIEGEDILKKEEQEFTFQETKVESPQQDLTQTSQVQSQNVPNEEQQEIATQESAKKFSFSEEIATLGWLTKIQKLVASKKPAKKLLVAFGLIVTVLVLGSLIFAKILTSAEITIKVNPKTYEDDFKVTVLDGSSSNLEKQQIPGQKVAGRSSGNRKAVTTGTREKGEYARGEVSVFNWTTTETKFSKDVVIISKNGTKFKLDQDVKIASRSASTPGQAKVAAVAFDFGPESNIGAGSEFTFQEYDELLYSATNDTAFSGGDKKKITVVSQSDIDKLEESLLDSLKASAVEDVKNNSSGRKIHDDVIEFKIVNKTFDKKVDEEANLVNLDMEIEAITIAYDESNLSELLAQIANLDAPENLHAKGENIQILTVAAKSAKNTLSLNGRFKANFIPKFDENELKDKIAGKNVKEVRQIIKGLPEVSDINVSFSPNLLFASSIPKNKQKITFKIES